MAFERGGILGELCAFMRVRKKWWLGPSVLMLALLAREPNIFGFPTTFGAGFWLMLIGAGGLVLGALMRVAASRRRPRAI